MKFFSLPILIILMLAASAAAQKIKNLPPNAEVSGATFDKAEKMLFRGTVFFRDLLDEGFFEMTLLRAGDDLQGNYFFVKSGRTSAHTMRGKIEADGKVFLREFDRANRAIGEFRGKLIENQDDSDLSFEGDWKDSSHKNRLDFSAGGQIIEFTGKQRIETVYISEKNLRRRVQIDAEYPQIRGEKNAAIRKFNLNAKMAVVQSVAEFKGRMRRQTAEDIKHLWGDGNTHSISYDLKFADDRLVSVIYFYSENSGGEPQPFDYVGTLNYDLEKNRELNLADLFKPGAKYLETISAYCIKSLQTQPSENGRELADSDWAKNITADIENYDNWNLTRKGLLITFNKYQLLSFAGEQSVLIPYSELKRIAAPGGALSNAAAQSVEINFSKPEKLFFRGWIDDYVFEMTLFRSGENLNGSYSFVDPARTSFRSLRGSIGADGNFKLREFDRRGRQTGVLTGEFSQNQLTQDDEILGEWKQSHRRETQKFYAVRQMIFLPVGWQFKTINLRQTNKRNPFNLQVEYPEIYGKIPQTIDFNRAARQRIDKDVLEFQQEMAARTEEEMRNPRSNQDALDISFDVKYADENIVSIQIFKSKFTNGIPHPLNEVSTFNYNLKSNRRLELKDLFLPGAKYLETISIYCLKVLQSRPPIEGEKLADGDWINGATAKVENYATWNLIKKGLLITFNDNQIAPYPATRQSVLIPYDKLKDIADPDGALAKITK